MPLPFRNVLFLSSQKASLAKGSCQLARSGQGANKSIQLYTVNASKIVYSKKSHSFDSVFFHQGLLLRDHCQYNLFF